MLEPYNLLEEQDAIVVYIQLYRHLLYFLQQSFFLIVNLELHLVSPLCDHRYIVRLSCSPSSVFGIPVFLDGLVRLQDGRQLGVALQFRILLSPRAGEKQLGGRGLVRVLCQFLLIHI